MKTSAITVWLATTIVTLIVFIGLFTLGLILDERLLYPLALTVTAIISGAVAGWTTNRLVSDGLNTPANPLVIRSIGVGVILTILVFVIRRAGWFPSPPIILIALLSLVLASATTNFALTQRIPTMDANSTRHIVAWIIGAIVAVPVVIFIGSLFGLTGA